jgi:hypothetical protein
MRSAEIGERDVRANGGKVAINIFAEPVAQSNEPL